MSAPKAALAWRATHCAICAVGCLLCAAIYPFALLVRGLSILEKAAERREEMALRPTPTIQRKGEDG